MEDESVEVELVDDVWEVVEIGMEGESVEEELVVGIWGGVDSVAEPELDSCQSKSSKSIK